MCIYHIIEHKNHLSSSTLAQPSGFRPSRKRYSLEINFNYSLLHYILVERLLDIHIWLVLFSCMIMDEKSGPLPTADHSAASSNPPPPAYPTPSVSKDTPPQGPYAVAPQQQQGSPYPPNTMHYTTQPQMVMVGGGMPQPQIGDVPQQQQLNNDVTVGTQFQNQLYAQCAQGNHDTVRKYGQCGIITAVCCFPCGLLAMLFDYEERCARCGVRVGGSTIR
ncbi:hypothetical protein C8Q75DRAFT_147972 [Abortiporus biennis]|nr:hypothetical protein C8Q75DRAFT_147972 [Abortiporus biennis]